MLLRVELAMSKHAYTPYNVGEVHHREQPLMPAGRIARRPEISAVVRVLIHRER